MISRASDERPRSRKALLAILAISGTLSSATLSCGERHARVDIKDAPARDRAHALTLDGGKILVDKGGRYDRVCPEYRAPVPKGGSGCVDHHFYVFPVVPTTWAPPQPVPAWVTCSANEKAYEQCEAWVKGYGGEIAGAVAVRVGDGGKATRAVSGWEEAIADAAKRHALSAMPRGPVLRLGRK